MNREKTAGRVLDIYLSKNSAELIASNAKNGLYSQFMGGPGFFMNGESAVLFPKMARELIWKLHSKPGMGSVFNASTLLNLHKRASEIDLFNSDKVYSEEVDFSGYDLVHDYEDFMENHSDDILGESYVEMWDFYKDKKSFVRSYIVSTHPSCFKTSIISYRIYNTEKILSSNEKPWILTSNAIKNKIIHDCIENGSLYSIMDATPGRYITGNQWNNKVIVIPSRPLN